MTNDAPTSPSMPHLARALLLSWDFGHGFVTLQTASPPSGAPATESIGAHLDRWHQAIHPDDLPSVVESFETHLQGRSLFFAAEYRLLSGPDTWLAVHDVSAVTHRKPDGTPIELAMVRTVFPSGVNPDVTQGDWQEVRRIGHDLNNLLGAILGYSEMLLEDAEPGQTLFTDLDRVHAAAQRASSVAGTLMAIARRRTSAPVRSSSGS